MFTPFVTDEHPVALYEGVPPQYNAEGLAIDCALVLHVKGGTARIRCNFEVISERKGSVVLFSPGDTIKVEQRSADFVVEILAFTGFIQLAALNQLEGVDRNALRRNIVLDSDAVSQAASGMVRMMRSAITACSVRELYFISVAQLRAFYMLYQVELRRLGIEVETFKSRADEIFYKFRQLLGEHYRTSRSVAFYADKLCITPRYLTQIVQSHYGKSPKEAIDIYTIMQMRLDLLQTDTPVSELAWRYNFSSPSFFSDYFSRNSGLSPQQYRQQQG